MATPLVRLFFFFSLACVVTTANRSKARAVVDYSLLKTAAAAEEMV